MSHHDYVVELSSVETAALSILKPVNVLDIDPCVVRVTDATRKIWAYWRFVLSSEDQSQRLTQGRMSCYFVIDNNTKGLLGLFAITDTPQNNPYFTHRWGWETRDVINPTPHQMKNKAQARGLSTIIALRRCLPVYEFGNLTGGKLFTLAAMSTEIVRQLELQYSFKLSILYARAVHGKASQYNRMHTYGLNYGGNDAKGAGYYIFNLRKGADQFLSGEKPKMGKLLTKSYADNVAEWKRRWFLPRAERLGVETITFDLDKYRLANKIQGD